MATRASAPDTLVALARHDERISDLSRRLGELEGTVVTVAAEAKGDRHDTRNLLHTRLEEMEHKATLEHKELRVAMAAGFADVHARIDEGIKDALHQARQGGTNLKSQINSQLPEIIKWLIIVIAALAGVKIAQLAG